MTLPRGRKYIKEGAAKQRIEDIRYGFYNRYGRPPIQLEITDNGVYEVGPFGHDGFDVQFGSKEATIPFDGTFAATIARSLRPGEQVLKENADEIEIPVMMPPAADADFDAASTAIEEGDIGVITHFDGQANRVRVVVTGYDEGSGDGTLVMWIM